MIACSASLMATWMMQDQPVNGPLIYGRDGIVQYLWLIPAIPMMCAGMIALLKQSKKKTAATLAIGGLAISLLLSLIAFVEVLTMWSHGAETREIVSFNWID